MITEKDVIHTEHVVSFWFAFRMGMSEILKRTFCDSFLDPACWTFPLHLNFGNPSSSEGSCCNTESRTSGCFERRDLRAMIIPSPSKSVTLELFLCPWYTMCLWFYCFEGRVQFRLRLLRNPFLTEGFWRHIYAESCLEHLPPRNWEKWQRLRMPSRGYHQLQEYCTCHLGCCCP